MTPRTPWQVAILREALTELVEKLLDEPDEPGAVGRAIGKAGIALKMTAEPQGAPEMVRLTAKERF